jgi:hypothetical protein
MTAIKTYVNNADRLLSSVAIHVAMVSEAEVPTQILRIEGDTYRWEELTHDGTNVEPTLVLNDATARSLLDALTRHYQGTEDTRALRRDYDAERKRVDQLLAALTQVAAASAIVLPEVAP